MSASSTSRVALNQAQRQRFKPVTIDHVQVQINTLPVSPSPGLLFHENREIYLRVGVPLYQAALKGDLETVREIHREHPEAICASITKGQETALHIAAAARRNHLVTELVGLMTPDQLAQPNRIGNTALCFAAASGTVEIAKVMVKKNRELPLIRGNGGMTPLYMAALLGHKEMVGYLYSVTDDADLKPEERIQLLVSTISTDLYDVALDMLNLHPELALARDENNETALHILAKKPPNHGGNRQSLWKIFVNSCSGKTAINDKDSMRPQAIELVKRLWAQVMKLRESQISNLIGVPWRLLFVAAELGNVDFLTTIIQMHPDMIWKVEENNRSIFHIAVMHRHQQIFSLIYEIGAIKDLIATYKDENENNMLHLAGMLAPPTRLNTVSGAALQMQRELIWFKEVEKIVQPIYAEEENRDRKTPRALFTDNHRGLMKEGENWMKNTASSCMLVATLIATVVFAAAFTVPGGNNTNGSPVFLKKGSFLVFAVSDAISLFSSSSSILMFLSILTSRYAEDDFYKSLPFKLMVGLTSLFISMVAMLIAFSATFFIVFHDGLAWVAIPIAFIALVPVSLFALQQYPLLADISRSTYVSSFLFHQSKYKLY